jgi:hypothetical protein
LESGEFVEEVYGEVGELPKRDGADEVERAR